MFSWSLGVNFNCQILFKVWMTDSIMRGTPPKWNYVLEGGLLVVQASPARWAFCISVSAGIVVRGCVQLQWIFIEDSQCVCPSCDGLFMSAPPYTVLVFSSFWPQTAWPPCPHPLYTPDLNPSNFCLFVSLDEKISQRTMFCRCGRGETKKWQKY